MKKRFIILFTLVSFFSCDSYLDEVPDNRQEVKTLDDVSELLVSAYSRATYNFVEAKSDNATYIIQNTQYPWMTENYTYVPVVSSEQQDTPTYFWDNTYNAIAHANQALVGLSEIDGGDDDFRNSLKGEALVSRAYNHFMLANIFALHYSEANKSALGIPYITAPETELSVSYERGTLEETYNLIEKDLLEGLPLISDDYYVGTGKYHFNKSAAYAFASRFYLFKGDYVKCIEYSNKLLGEGVVSINYIRDMDEVFTGTGSVQIANNFIDVSKPSNLLVVRKESFAVTRYTRGFQANSALLTEIYDQDNPQGSSDFRDLGYGFSSSSARTPPKYTELFEYTTSTTGFAYFIMPELRSEEVLLNRMEAYIMENRLEDALNDYNTMAPLRYSNGGQLTLGEVAAYYGGTEKDAMFSLVISERRKEFLREGLRWFDIKRLGLEVYHVVSTDGDGNVVTDVTLAGDDLRKAEQLPAKAIANGIEENPGY
ncbi:RagB/SusD family nutrient uptake outer membrane protein [Algibacter lectus]|uniref:Putative outer membrane protein n=1 Tax=Algibacter lectus TaxID=221126 RepID=A0A090W766_9FLAO|nr:RagB/SusD family nutrient uptake outer membrane protein [Algibacter lectus]GAL63367.1 putative outer membrane protein [Algibacter lectus]SFD42709.1 SusD family protein [Algibacter lectus]